MTRQDLHKSTKSFCCRSEKYSFLNKEEKKKEKRKDADDSNNCFY
jgi:hypothetical protein